MKKISLYAFLASSFLLQNCINHGSGGVSTNDIVIYSAKTITEASSNDGTFDETITATVEGTTFSKTLTSGTDYDTLDLPAGLSVTVDRINDTKVSIHFTGQATKHSFCSNGQMSFFFSSTAFADNKLPISFEVPISIQYISPVLTYSGFILDEDAPNAGNFSQTITVTTENGGTFSRSSGTFVDNTDYIWTDLPAGITPVITLNSNTSATITFPGTATDNTPFSDAIAKLKFTETALSSDFCAALAKKNVEFKFYRSVIMYAVDAPDGDLKGTALTARAGADELCAAGAPVLPDDYDSVHAFISISGTDEIRDMPGLYNIPTDVMIESIDSTNLNGKIADDWADLLSGDIDQDLDNAGVSGSNGTHFWTGSDEFGALATDNCSGWTDNTAMSLDGNIGISNQSDDNWLNNTVDSCDTTTNQILCIAYVAQ